MALAQTKTPFDLLGRPLKSALVAEFIGKHPRELRTPALVLDRHVFAKNCAKMHANAAGYGAEFRAHLKTHKTVEGTRLQLVSDFATTHAVVVSTVMEAWEVVKSGLVSDGVVTDILYGLPIPINKISDLSDLWDEVAKSGAIVRLLVDHPRQIEALGEFEKVRVNKRQWSVFVKVDGGQKRAGVVPGSPGFEILLKAILASPAISLHGFYSHAGNSYGSTGLSQASSFLSSEVETTNEAAKLALALISSWPGWKGDRRPKLVLSVGATPTAHSASAETRAQLGSLLYGTLELHAGNYPMLDLQQLNTQLVDPESISHKVIATVVSYYPGRGADGTDEALCDAGVIAMSKETGPREGYGEVIGKPWRLGRISQEHGVLTYSRDSPREELEVGSTVEIIGQHACLTAAAYPWYYITDSSTGDDVVVDIWVPWKGW